MQQSGLSSVEFPCEPMCVPIPGVAVGSSVLLILRGELCFLFFFSFEIIWVTRMQSETLQPVPLDERSNVGMSVSQHGGFVYFNQKAASRCVHVLLDAWLSK